MKGVEAVPVSGKVKAFLLSALLLVPWLAGEALAQAQADAAAQANNPLANMKAFNLQSK
ncbi:conserved hypothetical protein [delta proteobacterium NaphS2]|nr:conserved hypothetical protein [delta proteobacterium NaphS2]